MSNNLSYILNTSPLPSHHLQPLRRLNNNNYLEITTTTCEDTYILGSNGDANYGGGDLIEIDSDGPKYGLLKIDISGVPYNSQIINAKLKYRIYNRGDSGEVYIVTSYWDEMTTTFNTFNLSHREEPRLFGVQEVGWGSYDPYELDVTTTVQRWVNQEIPNNGFYYGPVVQIV